MSKLNKVYQAKVGEVSELGKGGQKCFLFYFLLAILVKRYIDINKP